MILLWNVNERLSHYQTLYRRSLAIYLSATVLFVGALILAIVFSPEDYDVLKWCLIAAGTFYLWGSLYYFGVTWKNLRRATRFYRSVQNGLRAEEVVSVVGLAAEDELTKDGLTARRLKTSFVEKGQTFERDFYLLDSSISLPAGTKIRAMTFSNVLLGYEVLP